MPGLVSGLALALIALVAFPPGVSAGDTWPVLGVRMNLRDPGGDAEPERRRMSIMATDKLTDEPFNGNPTLDGADLTIITRGEGGIEYSQTIHLPAEGWIETLKKHDWPVFKSYLFSNRDVGGPVRRVIVRRAGFASPEGTPPPEQPDPHWFRMKVVMVGKEGPITVVPPNPATEAGVFLTLGTGDTYCSGFGGAAGGTFARANDEKRFTVRRPELDVCPVPSP